MIQGERVRLRRAERSDLPRFAVWLNDPEVRRHLALIYPMGQAQEEQWFEEQLKAEPAAQAFVIEARTDSNGQSERRIHSGASEGAQGGPDAASPLFDATAPEPAWQPVGVIGYHAIDWRNRAGELGLFIGDRSFWNAGFGTDAVRTLVDWGFRQLNLNRVFLRVFEDNASAIRCYEKVGFRPEGRLRQDRYQDGRYLDTLVMGLLRDEYAG